MFKLIPDEILGKLPKQICWWIYDKLTEVYGNIPIYGISRKVSRKIPRKVSEANPWGNFEAMQCNISLQNSLTIPKGSHWNL